MYVDESHGWIDVQCKDRFTIIGFESKKLGYETLFLHTLLLDSKLDKA